MNKLDFYLLPSGCYGKILVNDLFILEKIINQIKIKDKFFIPVEFYYKEDEQGVTASEYLYEMEQNDVNTYLLEIISKGKGMSTDGTYDSIYGQNYIGYVAFACDKLETKIERICAYKSEDDIIKVKRFYIMKSKSYEEYISSIYECFPNLIFHEDAFNVIRKLGKFKDIKEELQRHLVVLCDNAKNIYYECYKKEEETFAVLKSKYGIICSGKGSKEEKEFKVDYHGVSITCNPHTKLYTEYSDKRIYFCWGRDDIEGHKIIVVRIGNHWN